MLAGTGIELPESVRESDVLLINQINEHRSGREDTGLHKRVDELHSTIQQLLEETRKGNRSSAERLPDGRYRITDENGNVQIVKYT